MDGSSYIDSISPAAAITSIRPTVPRAVAARHTRDLNDIRMLKVRVKNVFTLGGDLIDFGAGNRNTADELSAALHMPQFQYTVRERKAVQAEIDSCLIQESACREELANVPPWEELANRLTWNGLANVARWRELAGAAAAAAS
jgi:hypothetical protein